MTSINSSRRTSMAADRRPSMAERRPSTINSRRPSVIPYLEGIEKPILPTLPSDCDVLICGTGLVESILAASLSWQGSNVLHIDSNPYYGDNCSTLTIEQIKSWCNNVNLRGNNIGFKNFENAKLYIPFPSKLHSRDYGIDLSPKILFAKSDLLTLLINSRVYNYLEFQSLSNFHTFENDSFGKILSSKEEIFTNKELDLILKRSLMKFMKFVLEYDDLQSANSIENLKVLESYKKIPLKKFLTEKFKLNSQQINEIIFTIGLSTDPNINTIEGLSRIKRYLISFNIYGNFPTLYSKFGGPGEISQGFCRSAAVAGTTYKLNTCLKSFDPINKIATLNDDSKIKINEKLICSPSQSPSNSTNLPKQSYSITRLVTIVEKSCREWFTDGESASVVVFPPSSLPSNNKFPVQCLIIGSGSGCCPVNQCIWYLSTIETGEKTLTDLDCALVKMEESILRESEFDVELDEDDIEVGPNGNISVKNSIKLGKSFKEFVPKAKLNYLLKLSYIQKTSTPPFGIIKSGIFNEENETDYKAGPDNGIIYSSMPSTEISYDGVISEAKILYSKIVGTDEGFFDVDFEDDDEESNNNGNNNTYGDNNAADGDLDDIEKIEVDEMAIVDDDDVNEMDFEL